VVWLFWETDLSVTVIASSREQDRDYVERTRHFLRPAQFGQEVEKIKIVTYRIPVGDILKIDVTTQNKRERCREIG
jgi:hypothetical protein